MRYTYHDKNNRKYRIFESERDEDRPDKKRSKVEKLKNERK